MHPTSTAITNCIEGFNLMNPEGTVNLTTETELKSGNSISKIRSEVFILSVNPKNVDTVYLLNTEITDMNYPVMFQSGREVFSYIDDVCLIIVGSNAGIGDYVISIFPEKK